MVRANILKPLQGAESRHSKTIYPLQDFMVKVKNLFHLQRAESGSPTLPYPRLYIFYTISFVFTSVKALWDSKSGLRDVITSSNLNDCLREAEQEQTSFPDHHKFKWPRTCQLCSSLRFLKVRSARVMTREDGYLWKNALLASCSSPDSFIFLLYSLEVHHRPGHHPALSLEPGIHPNAVTPDLRRGQPANAIASHTHHAFPDHICPTRIEKDA